MRLVFYAALALALLFFAVYPAWAHYPIPVVPLPPVTAAPPVVAVPPPASSAPPSAASPAGAGTPWLGIGVMVGVAVFFYLAICQTEEKRDPEQFKRLHCPATPDWHVAPPFTFGP